MKTYIVVRPQDADAAIGWLCCLKEYTWTWSNGYPYKVCFRDDEENACAFKLKFGSW